MGGYQNYGPFLGTLKIRCRIINRDPKRDHKFDSHPCRAFPNEIPVRDSGSWASGDRIFWDDNRF